MQSARYLRGEQLVRLAAGDVGRGWWAGDVCSEQRTLPAEQRSRRATSAASSRCGGWAMGKSSWCSGRDLNRYLLPWDRGNQIAKELSTQRSHGGFMRF